MAKNKVSEWSATPANNTDIGGIDIAEGCAPSGINNAIRELMAQVKDMQAGTDGDNLTVGGNLSVTGTTAFTGTVVATAKIDSSGGFFGDVTGNVTGNVTGTASKATNIVGGNNTTQLGSIPYQSNTDTTTLLAPNTTTTKKYLSQTGNGTNGAAPAWVEVNLLTMATAVSPTGTSTVNFTNIPSWANKIIVSLYRISGTSGATTTIQIGTGGVLTTTGYSAAVTYVADSASGSTSATTYIAGSASDDASTAVSGNVIITRVDGNKWVATGSFNRSGDARVIFSQGSVELSGTLDIVGIARASGTFDAGTINIMYE